MSGAPALLWDGPAAAATTVLLAPGAGSDCRSEFLAAAAEGLGAAGLRVARFDFPYMQQRGEGRGRRGPDPMPVLQQCMREAVTATGAPLNRLVIGGKSMGGRVATMLADELQVAGVVVFGYPFHPPRQPTRLRTEHLQALRTPCLILQGERDPFGTRDEVAGYALSAAIEIVWFTDGDHSLVPRARSGATAAQHRRDAIARAAAFAQRLTAR